MKKEWKRRKGEGEIRGAKEKKSYGKKAISDWMKKDKIISDWMKKEWTRKEEAADICSVEGKEEANDVQWSKYTVMKREFDRYSCKKRCILQAGTAGG